MNLRELFPLLIFLGLCFSMARCGITNNKTYTNNPSRMTTPSRTSPPRTNSPTPSAPRARGSEARLRSDVVQTAKKQLGKKYISAGKDTKGFDCSGLTCYVLGQHDIALTGSSATQELKGKPIPIREVQAGDLIYFRREKKGRVFHVAMVVANEKDGIKIIHSTSSRGVVIDNLDKSTYWKPKVSTARDVIGR